MFNIKKSKFSREQGMVSTSTAHNTSLGTNSHKKQADAAAAASKKDPAIPRGGKGMEATAAIQTSMTNTTISNTPIGIDTDPMLVGIVPSNYRILYALYRDIYYNDPVGGSAVDLMSSLPFSDFNLGGLDDPKIASVFEENVERLGVKTLIPEMSVDYLVLGQHCHSLLYNKDRKMFVDVMPYAPENLQVQTLPFYSQDPIINVSFPEQYKAVLQSGSKRINHLRSLVGNEIFSKIAGGNLELDPLSTVYIPRKTFSDTDQGVSYFRRLLPIYLIEKNLHRGTLVESARRQRGIMHLTLGEGDEWIPSPDDMNFITELFMNADTDPLGAIVTTRSGVAVEEIRQGGDFWKVTDFADSVLPTKLRALGISEAFLSGDANYNVADNSMTVFVEMLRSYRDMMTRKFLYEKVFPLISMINGYAINAKGKVIRKEGLMDTITSPEEALFRLNDGSKLLIPTVEWSKQLKPEGDSQYMEMLNQMTEKGVPIPIRVMAAAGGLSLDDLLKQQDDDLKIRKRLADYKKEIDKVMGEGEGEDGGEDDMAAEASSVMAQRMLAVAAASHTRSAVHMQGGKIPLLNREFGDSGEIIGRTVTGKKTYIHNQRRANERLNRQIAKAAANPRNRLMGTHKVQLKN